MVPTDPGSFIAGGFVPVSAPDGVISRSSPADLDDALPDYRFARSHVDDAVTAARAAQPAWDALGLAARTAHLVALRDALARNEEPIALCIAREMGKPLREARAEAKAMVAKVDITVGEAQSLVRDAVLDAKLSYRWRPHGVLGVLGPFNFPLHLPHGHIAPALLAGNSVVFKPSEVTPGCAALYARVVAEAGIPPGVFNLVQGDGSVGAKLGAHPGVDGVLFTGSYAVGAKLIAANASEPGRLLALELGGKNAAVVLDDAPFEKALTDVLLSAFSTAGQRCTCASRLIVTRSIAERFVERLAARAARITVGHPMDPSAFHGPLASPAALARFEALQAVAESEGASVVVEARAPQVTWEGRTVRGCYVSPRVRRLSDPMSDGRYATEELFGPDLSVAVAEDVEHAIAIADHSPYGLAAGVWTASEASFERCARALRVGTLSWNTPTVGASSRLPFGGVKRSGNHRPAALFSSLYCAYPLALTRGDATLDPKAVPPGVPVDG